MTTPQNDKGPKIPDNEFRISPKTNIYFALERIEKAFKTFDHIVLSGINAGISRVLLIAEITKLKIGALHQYNFLETMITEIKEETSDKTVEKQEKFYPMNTMLRRFVSHCKKQCIKNLGAIISGLFSSSDNVTYEKKRKENDEENHRKLLFGNK